jgi:hypothetical protein
MITNTGKNIIAKYLIGDAPAYASFIALGCGPRPRPNINTKSAVSTASLSGTILSNGVPITDGKYVTPITGIATTAPFVVGMVLTKVSGTGAFGADTTIISIDSPTQITVSSPTGEHTPGALNFSTGGVAQVLSVESTSGMWLGAKIKITSGAGTLASLVDTKVSAISSETVFTITPGPTTNLLNATVSLEIDPEKQSLDFEMFRVPISSRGYVNDDGVNKIILTAQLPTEERYEISEIGIYSAGSNSIANRYDSKTISAFASEENWRLSVGNSLVGPAVNNEFFTEVQNSLIDGLNFIINTPLAIKTSSTNGLFSNATRSARYERPRYLSNVFMLRGDSSFIYDTSGSMNLFGEPSFLQIDGQRVDFTKNSSSDLLKVAFSIVSVDGNSSAVPDSARVVIEFSNSDNTQYARMQVEARNSVYRFSNNRYLAIEKRLDELFYSSGQFSWDNVSIVRAYVATVSDLLITQKALTNNIATITVSSSHGLKVGNFVRVSGVDETFNGVFEVLTTPAANIFTYAKTAENVSSELVVPNGKAEAPNDGFYIALDAIRLDNVSTVNPIYGLTGYSIIQNSGQVTVAKAPNTSNFIEYRFILDVT